MRFVYFVDGVAFRGGKRVWTKADDRALRKLYPDLPTVDVAKQIGRTIKATYARAKEMGLHKSATFMASPAAYRFRRDYHAGWEHRYPKGHVPANKGLRRPGYSVGRGRMQETQFKKGVPSRNYMPVGATSLSKDGYVLRKVSDIPNFTQNVNWKLEHRLVGAAANGPVPSGYALKFRDGNRQNTSLENLELIQRRTLMAQNTVHNLPKPLASTIQLLGQLKRRIRERTERAQEQNRRSA